MCCEIGWFDSPLCTRELPVAYVDLHAVKVFESPIAAVVGTESEEEGEEGATTGKTKNGKSEKSIANGQKPEESTIHEEHVRPKSMADLPPLFLKLEERPAERLHYVGVSYGLTQQLLRFWQNLGFTGLYLRQTASDVTGEHTCIMLKPLASEELQSKVCSVACELLSTSCLAGLVVLEVLSRMSSPVWVKVKSTLGIQAWVTELNKDFLERFAALLPGAFRDMPPATVLALLQPKLTYSTSEMEKCATAAPEVRKPSGQVLDAHDLKRLQVRC